MGDDHRPVLRHELVFDVEQALRKARKLWPRKVVHGDYNPLKPIADAVVEHPELCGITCFRRPPREPHSIPGGPLNMSETDATLAVMVVVTGHAAVVFRPGSAVAR